MMRTCILLLFVFSIAGKLSAQSDVSFVRLPRAADNFALPDGRKLRIHGSHDDVTRVALNGILFESPLRFSIIPDDSMGVYYVKHSMYGEVVVIESNFPSSSGLSANVINLSFLLIKEDRIIEAEYANSLFRGVADIEVNPNGILVKVLSFKEYIENYVPVCCATDFKLGRNFKLIRIAKTTCVNYSAPRKLVPSTCNCEQAYFPVVMD